MNRHERRRQKRSNKLNQTVNPDLLQGIKLHTNKNYKKVQVNENIQPIGKVVSLIRDM